jgi:O-antigen/teichoic acid export membrane protein
MIEFSEGVGQFIGGATFLGDLVIGLFFLRFWRQTADRLFAIFSLAFFVFAFNRVLLTFLHEENEGRTFVYILRLGAFLLIIAGIIDKNRPRHSDPS